MAIFRKSTASVVLILAVVSAAAVTRSQGRPSSGSPAIDRLVRDSHGGARVSLHRATGVARFVRLEPVALPLRGRTVEDRAVDFLARHGGVFGIRDAGEELAPAGRRSDPHGGDHVRYLQRHRGLPVFGGEVRVHFDRRGRLTAANGTFVPGITIDPTPRLEVAEAGAIGVGHVRSLHPDRDAEAQGAGADSAPDLEARRVDLMVFRSGLVQGVSGRDHLAYRVEVGDGASIRQFVFVDAHEGTVIDRISGIHDLIHRTIHEPQFNNLVIWSEGDALPFDSGNPLRDTQVNTLIGVSFDTYRVYASISGGAFLSWNGTDGVLHNVFNIPSGSEVNCPNAFWDGQKTNYCNGVTGDDTVAHEWSHAYTESTHNLIYQWQSGALNEAYSDIFGEIVDLLNGTGLDAPGPPRTPGTCSTFGGPRPPDVEILAPATIAGAIGAGGADFNPNLNQTVTAAVALVDDGDSEGGLGTVTDGCQALLGFPVGRIALIDRGRCTFTTKIVNAQNAGAIGVLIGNTADTIFTMSGSNSAITIPSAIVRMSDANLIKANFAAGVTARLATEAATDVSYRWLTGEDDTAFGGAIRDLWDPTCFRDPGNVTDQDHYVCSTADDGGVHTNSGVPNHGFALLVDGGTYNGRTVGAIGLTRAAHLYWRAEEIYQVPASDFGDHADALEQSCADLIGVDLFDLATGAPSGEVLSADDCSQVAEALLAVEMRTDPAFCNFQPILAPDPPAIACGSVLLFDDFETSPAATWSLNNSGVYSEYTPRDWLWKETVPPGGTGRAFFALDSATLGDCTPGSNDQSGVMHLDSPVFAVPQGAAILAFDHYVATEPGYDGGNLKASVSGGPFTTVPAGSYRFNPYYRTLATAAELNTNPIAGEPAFSGTDGGQNRGSWGQSQVDLSGLATSGDSVRLRFTFGVDGCNGVEGWYVDNVRVCIECVGEMATDADGDGFRRCDADCDDADATVYSGAPEINDGQDNQCILNPGFGLSDEIEGVLGFFNPLDLTEISWPGQPGATSYDLAWSETAAFAPSCVTFMTAAPVYRDPAVPPVGAAYHYLVRASAPNAGSWGRDSAGTERAPACAPPAP